MIQNNKYVRFRFLIAYFFILMNGAQVQAQTNFDVVNTLGTGAGSLRQAILDLNASVAAGPYQVRFLIGATNSSQTIMMGASLLADINKSNVTINGWTQNSTSSCTGVPLITVNFNGLSRGFRNLSGTTNLIIQGLVLQNADAMITFQGGSGHIVRGCYIGLASNGLSAGPTTATPLDAIEIDGSTACIIGGSLRCERNYICQFRHAINVGTAAGTPTNHIIRNNFIGLAIDGSTVVGNRQDGIRFDDVVTNGIIGGMGAFDRNVISGNGENGVNLNNTGNTGYTITNNYIGLDSTGLLVRSNGRNVTAAASYNITSNGNNTIVQNNVMAGDGATYNNFVHSVYFRAGNNQQLLNNIIGLDQTGLASVTNFGSYNDGVRFEPISSGHVVTDNIICNSGNGRTNLEINVGRGIYFDKAVTNVTVKGNKIGVDQTAINTKGNHDHGIAFNDDVTGTIGGALLSERNYFCANGFRAGATGQKGHGFYAAGTPVTITYTNNYTGLAADGSTNVGNGQYGIYLSGAVSSTITNNYSWYNRTALFLVSSGTTAINGNTISNNNFSYNSLPAQYSSGITMQQGCNYNKILNNIIQYNTQGIWLRFQNAGTSTGGNNDNNTIQGNEISYNSGVVGGGAYTALESDGNGIVISGESDRNLIGGWSAATDNQIHDNAGNGILIFEATSTENKIRRNSIYCNGGKGINLNGAGNINKAHPGAYTDPTLTVPNLVASGTGGNLATDTVEVFWDNACGDCEGKTFLGLATVTAAGTWNFPSVPATTNLTVRGTERVLGQPLYGNTSEFSACLGLPLPIGLLYLKATLTKNNTGLIQWGTFVEVNNDYFIVQKSTDTKEWVDIGKVKGNGDTDYSIQYTFEDTEVGEGETYYRLMQVDRNQKSSLSPIVSIAAFDKDPYILKTNSFDRSYELISLLPANENMTVQVIDVSGKVLYETTVFGGEQLNLLAHSTPGLYVVRLLYNSTLRVVKLVK